MTKFEPNHFVDGPYIELNKPTAIDPDIEALRDDDDESDDFAVERKGALQHFRIRAVGRGNFGSNNYQCGLELVETVYPHLNLTRDYATKEPKRNDPKRVENILSSYVFPGKKRMSYEECAAEIEAMRTLFKDPKNIEPLLKNMKIPSELMERYRESVSPYQKISTAVVRVGNSVLFLKKQDEKGQEQLVLPTGRIVESYRAESNLRNLFYREARVRLDDVKIQSRIIDKGLRVVFQGATATLLHDSNIHDLRSNPLTVFLQNEYIETDSRIDDTTKLYLSWIIEGESGQREGARARARARAEAVSAAKLG